MTLRQLWLRIDLLVEEADSPLRRALRAAQAEVEAREHAAALDDVHTRYLKKG